MATVARTISAGSDKVFAALADGWSYSDWVVGTAHIRDVDASWPEPGSKLHHRAGPWPFSIEDTSTAKELIVGRRLVLVAGLWPFGEATVVMEVTQLKPEQSRVVMYERFDAGVLSWIQSRLSDLVLHRRNAESLRRLADIVERSS